MAKVPIIVGAVLGGLALFIVLTGLFLFCLHRRKQRKQGPLWDEPILGSPSSGFEAQSPQMASGPHTASAGINTYFRQSTMQSTMSTLSHQPSRSYSLAPPSPQVGSGRSDLHIITDSRQSMDTPYQPALSHSLPSSPLQFVEGSTSSPPGSAPRTSAMVAFGNEAKSVVVLSPETEELPPPYAEFHES